MNEQTVCINISASGPPASGKTTAITIMTEALEKEFVVTKNVHGHDLVTLWAVRKDKLTEQPSP